MTVFSFEGVTYRYSSAENGFFSVTALGLILGLIYPIINDGSIIANLFSIFATLLPIIAVFIFYNRCNHGTFIFLRFYVFVALYMIFVGVVKGGFSGGISHVLSVIGQDIRYLMLFWLGGLYASNDRYMAMFHRLMLMVARIGFIMGVIAVVLWSTSGSLTLRGTGDNHLIYSLWWGPSVCYAYCGCYGLLKKKNRRLFLGVLILYFIMGLGFLKRSSTVDTIVLFGICMYLLAKTEKAGSSVGMFFLAGIFVFVVNSFFGGVLDNLINRFSETTNDIESFDRLVEWRAFQENSSTMDKIFGCGVGNYLLFNRFGLEGLNAESTNVDMLHLGYANIIYKGGVFYALFYILLYIKIFTVWSKKKAKTPMYFVCFAVSVCALISLFFEGSWTYLIIPFCISAPIFYATNNN